MDQLEDGDVFCVREKSFEDQGKGLVVQDCCKTSVTGQE